MLSNVRVLSFSHFLQGPSASQLLGDLGADVLKIEPPTGAFERSWSGPDAYLSDVSVFFLLGNRNVKSLAFDLKSPDCAEVLNDLIASADVLIESFRPGTMDRLGLGYERVAQINPRLVYCSLSGYGSSGPYVDRPGQDLLLQAMSGLVGATGRSDQPPTPVGACVVDQHGAVLAAFGILAALYARESTGKGMKVESNLLNAALDLQIEPLGYYLNGFENERSSLGVSSMYYKAPYGVFATADGYLCLSLNSSAVLRTVFDDKWFETVPENESYARRDEVNKRISEHMQRCTTAHWEARFIEHRVWFAPVNSYADVVKDPQVQYNQSFSEFEHPDAGRVRLLGHPITYDGRRPGIRHVPPGLGADTHDVLASLGYNDERIDRVLGKDGEGHVAR